MNGTLNKVKRAWLITWISTDNHTKVKDEFAAIVSWRFGSKKIKEITKQIYISGFLSLPEQIAYTKDKKICPYKIQYTSISVSKEIQEMSSLPSHVPFGESMIIGGNPWLWARIVDDLEAWIDEDFVEHLRWKEREKPFLGENGIEFEWKACYLKRAV